MSRRMGRRAAWATTAAALATALATAGIVVAVRGGHGGTPAAEPPSSTSPTAAATLPPTSSASRVSSSPPQTTTAPPSRSTPVTTTARSTATPTAGPAAFPPALRGQDVTVLPTSRRVVALTFDAGANAAGLPSILRTLADEHVTATFFLTGQWAQANPAGVAAIRAGGHRIGNHTMTHPHLPALGDAALRGEVLGGQQAIQAAGADPRPLFRFPFGDRDARTIAAVNALGYVAVRWTVDTLGWEGTAGGMSAGRVAARALGALRPGEIVLMHIGSNPDDGTTFDADALHDVIEHTRAAGYGFVTLDTLVG